MAPNCKKKKQAENNKNRSDLPNFYGYIYPLSRRDLRPCIDNLNTQKNETEEMH